MGVLRAARVLRWRVGACVQRCQSACVSHWSSRMHDALLRAQVGLPGMELAIFPEYSTQGIML